MKKFWKKSTFEKILIRLVLAALPFFFITACAPADVVDGHSVSIPAITHPLNRHKGLNENRNPITRVKLGRDILIPQTMKEDIMPNDTVGPFEMRNETLASALRLILDGYNFSLAFETDEGLKGKITVSNLHGKLKNVVNRVCSLADLYCHFEQNTLTIKDTEKFIVDLPPISAESSSSDDGEDSDSGITNEAYTQIATGLAAVIGTEPIIDHSTRIMIYTATQRTNKYALQYFERLRKNTALIIFETHIWEVTLNNNNRTGIKWDALFSKVVGSKFNLGISLPGGAPAGTGQAIAITAGAGANANTQTVLEFISERGAVKTISQPQITVLSGSTATLAVTQDQNFVKSITRTPSTTVPPGPDTFTPTPGTVQSGLTMRIKSAWDQSTVYGSLSISLNDLLKMDTFGEGYNAIQQPKTSMRSLETEIRVRPGDSILIGGLVSEKDNLSDSGPGFMKPLFATSRDVSKVNTELVFLIRPRVVVFVQGNDDDTPPIADVSKRKTAEKENFVSKVSKKIKNFSKQKKTYYPTVLPAEISAEALAPQAIYGGTSQ